MLAAVVTGEPPWDKLPAATPAAVRRLLRRCLEKDIRKRLRDAGDASLLLDDNPEDAAVTAGPDTGAVPPTSLARRKALAIMGLVAIASLAAGWWMAHRRTAAPAASAVSFHRVTFHRGMLRAARFAPDGRTIVYGAAWGGPPIKLYLTRTESPESAPIALPPAELFAISRTGEMAVALDYAFYGWMADGTLARTSLLGGAPREILQNVRAADWSPDESQFAIVHRTAGGDQLEYPVGTVLDKTSGYFADVRISPDGERVAYSDHPAWGDNRGGVSVVDRAGKKTLLVRDLEAIQGVVWAPGGKEIWYTDSTGDEGRVCAVDLGGKMRVVYSSIAAIELFDIAADGRLLVGRQHPERESLALLAGFAEPRALVIPGEASLSRGITADGRAVLVANHSTHDYDTFMVRSDQPGAVHIASGDGMGISPDFAWVMTSSADYRRVSITPTGMGATRLIPNPGAIEYQSLASWLPDGRRFVITGKIASELSRGFVCDLQSGAAQPFGAPGVMWPLFTGPPVSPDGKRAVLQDADGSFKVWPLDGGEGVAVPGTRAEDQPITFTEDGAALFVAGRSLPVVIERLELATGQRTPWMTMAPTDRAGLRYAIATITPNGKYWTLSTAKLLTDLYVVEGLR